MTNHESPDETALVFTGGQLVLRQQTAQGTTFKCISAASVRAAFATERLDSGWLPSRASRVGWSTAGQWLLLHYPAQRYRLALSPLPLHGTNQIPPTRLTIPFPGFLFLGVQHRYFIWAIRDATPAKARAYHAPLPNVHENGAICFGSHDPPQAAAHTMEQAWTLFWTTAFNSDLSAHKCRRHPRDVRHTWLTLTSRRTRRYPSDALVSIRESVDQLLARALDHA